LAVARRVLAEVAAGEVQVDEQSRQLVAPVRGGAGDLSRALRTLDDEGVTLQDVGLRRPTLDDVFLTLTGHGAGNGAGGGSDGSGDGAGTGRAGAGRAAVTSTDGQATTPTPETREEVNR
jgi:ABC-2 type transport system ATP-binding protein